MADTRTIHVKNTETIYWKKKKDVLKNIEHNLRNYEKYMGKTFSEGGYTGEEEHGVAYNLITAILSGRMFKSKIYKQNGLPTRHVNKNHRGVALEFHRRLKEAQLAITMEKLKEKAKDVSAVAVIDVKINAYNKIIEFIRQQSIKSHGTFTWQKSYLYALLKKAKKELKKEVDQQMLIKPKEERICRLEKNVTELGGDVNGLEKMRDDKEKRLAELAADQNKLQDEYDASYETSEERDRRNLLEISRQMEIVRALEEELGKLRSQKSTNEETIGNLQKENEELKEIKKGLDTQLADTKKENDQLVAVKLEYDRMRHYTTQLEAQTDNELTAAVEQMQMILRRTEKEVSLSKEQYQENERTIQRLQSEIDALKNEKQINYSRDDSASITSLKYEEDNVSLLTDEIMKQDQDPMQLRKKIVELENENRLYQQTFARIQKGLGERFKHLFEAIWDRIKIYSSQDYHKEAKEALAARKALDDGVDLAIKTFNEEKGTKRNSGLDLLFFKTFNNEESMKRPPSFGGVSNNENEEKTKKVVMPAKAGIQAL